MRTSTTLIALAGLTSYGVAAVTLSKNAQSLQDESMEWIDSIYDSKVGYLYDPYGSSALIHDTRTSIWYAFGLLVRNDGKDASEAERIINQVIDAQFTDPSQQWYGTYQKYPEEPVVGIDDYPQKAYSTWDPNWRGFIGTIFALALEEYSDILTQDTQDNMIESLRLVAEGDTYRGSEDNIYNDAANPDYSNAALMRAFTTAWIGRRVNNDSMISDGETYAKGIVELFNITDTLSEFNSPTYQGVSLYAIALSALYLPKDSIMGGAAPTMFHDIWAQVIEMWHPDLHNMAGSWDRNLGWDMTRSITPMSLWIWALVGRDATGFPDKAYRMSQIGDYPQGPHSAVLATLTMNAGLFPNDTMDKLATFSGEHTYECQAYRPPGDLEIRNVTAWLGHDLMIGAVSFNNTEPGGPQGQTDTYCPAMVRWKRDDGSLGMISMVPTEAAMQVNVSANTLCMTYPEGNSTSQFQLAILPFFDATTYQSWDDVPGISVTATGNVSPTYNTSFAGQYGGAYEENHDYNYWRFDYLMPSDFTGQPNLCLDIKVTSESKRL